MLFLQKLSGFGVQPLLLEEGKTVAGYMDVDSHMEVGFRRANGALRRYLNVAVLPSEGYLVLANDGGLCGVVARRRAAEFGLPGDRPQLVIQHSGAAARAVDRRPGSKIAVSDCLEWRQRATPNPL